MKTKEFFKSLILILLVAAMLIQTVQLMLFNLLYTGNTDSSFVLRSYLSDIGLDWVAGLIPSSSGSSEDEFLPERFLYPYSITVRTGGVTYGAYANKSSLFSLCKDIDTNLLTVMIEAVPAETNAFFDDAAKADGILIDFGRLISTGVVSGVLGGSSDVGGVFFRYCFIKQESGGIALYLKGADGATYRSSSAGQQYIQRLHALLQSAPTLSILNPLHVTGNGVVSGVALPSGLVYPDAAFSSPQPVKYNNPIYSDPDYNTKILTDLFTICGMSYGSPRRDVRKDKSVEYIENLSSIVVSPSGLLHFQATKTSGGIPISQFSASGENLSPRLTDVLSAAQVFTEQISSCVATNAVYGQDAELRFREAKYDKTDDTCVITFDYCVDGMPLVIDGVPYAAQIRYDRGYFTDFSYYCREYYKYPEYSVIPDLATAMKFYSLSGVTSIRRFDIGYLDDGGDLLYPHYILYQGK